MFLLKTLVLVLVLVLWDAGSVGFLSLFMLVPLLVLNKLCLTGDVGTVHKIVMTKDATLVVLDIILAFLCLNRHRTKTATRVLFHTSAM